MAMTNKDTIAQWCRSYLFNYQHPSREFQTNMALKELAKAIAEETMGQEPPPPQTLGIHVAETIKATDKVGG